MLRIKRLLHFEYWPFWVFYLPAMLYGLFLALKARSFTYFTTVNPGMELSGALEVSKSGYLKHIPDKYLPKMELISKNIDEKELTQLLSKSNIKYPFIAKPDTGLRGVEVEKIDDYQSLQNYLKHVSRPNILIQEFIDSPVELGVLIAIYPEDQRKEITSVTLKKFLTVSGDGKSTLKELVTTNIRAVKRRKEFEEKFSQEWNNIVPQNKTILMEPIGNHNRGTEFMNASHLNNETLLKVIDNIVKHVPGFFYGRLDIKAQSIEKLMKGEGITVLEINGVNSEPTHIYDTRNSIFSAYRDVFKHMKIIYKIARQNRLRGEKNASFTDLMKGLYQLYSH